MRAFEVAHEHKVLEIYRVTLPDSVEIPEDFEKWSFEQMDEWLWENQHDMTKIISDHIDGQVVAVLPCKDLSLKLVK